MKALSIKNPWAIIIEKGLKTIETRKWKTDYRGDLLICVSKKEDMNCSPNDFECLYQKTNGKALCVVELYDCVPMTEEHQEDACCGLYDGAWAWKLRNLRKIKSFPIKGQLRLFNLSVKELNNIEYI